MEARSGPLHQHKVTRILVNGAAPGDEPTAANILNALASLRNTNANDTVMVFLAGHGSATESGNYHFLPTDAARLDDGGLRPSNVVPWSALQEALESAKGRRILFLDSCHSGNHYGQRLTNDAYQANIIVYAAARWDQKAWQSNLRGGHGLFALATVEGVGGKAPRGASGGITTLGLRDYLVERVRELATNLKLKQEPQFFRARDAEDYVLAIGQ